MPSTAPNSARTAPALELRQHLALVLLSREVGQRIPTVQDLQATAQVGTGTVIKALRSLENSGAVSLSSHGHQGTVVSQRNVGILWNEAQLGNFVLATPPPGPVEQYGIVEAIQATLNRMNIPVSIAYIPGARERLAAVFHSRAHAVVTSVGAFDHHREDFPGLNGIDLGESSFYAKNSLVVVEMQNAVHSSSLVVGIDRGSFDHSFLTQQEFSSVPHTLVDCRFVSAPAAVLAGRVDAAVWHSMPTVIPPELAGLRLRPVRDSARTESEAVSRAVLVSRNLDAGVTALLRSISTEEVARTQQKLLKAASSGGSDGGQFWPR
jgi:hypothetical protein